MNPLSEKLRNEGFYATQELEATEVADEIDRLTAEVTKLETAIRWALGESPPDTPEFPIVDSPPYYRWRTQLRVLSGLSPVSGSPETEYPVTDPKAIELFDWCEKIADKVLERVDGSWPHSQLDVCAERAIRLLLKHTRELEGRYTSFCDELAPSDSRPDDYCEHMGIKGDCILCDPVDGQEQND